MAERAREADTSIRSGHHADHGPRVDESERVRRIGQVDGAGLNAGKDWLRHHVDVDLQPGGQRGRRAHAIANTAIARTGNRRMQPQRVTPEALVAKRVEAKNLQAPTEELTAGVLDGLVE